MVIFLFTLLAVLLVMGVPIGIALGLPSIVYIIWSQQIPDLILVQRLISGVDSFVLLAVPFFILAGNLMNTAGITDRIFRFATAVVGHLKGGLGHVNIFSSIIFAGMSGAAIADAGGLGTIEIKAMEDDGYDTDFSAAVTAASSTIGPIIPPSLPMVIYGVMASASIGKLFAAGFLPGLVMGLALMALVAYFAVRRNYPSRPLTTLKNLGLTFRGAFFPLLTPAIIVGGIVSGIVTPTEAAVVAVVYAMVLGFVYRSIGPRDLVPIFMNTIETTAVVMFIVANASIFGWILIREQIPQLVAESLLQFTDSRALILLMINGILLVVGFFMETIAAITILVPVFLPVITRLDIDPVHFGVIMVLNLMIGLLTPPVGMVLFVLARVSRSSFEQLAKATLPFLVPLVLVLLLITFVPQISLWLPSVLFD